MGQRLRDKYITKVLQFPPSFLPQIFRNLINLSILLNAIRALLGRWLLCHVGLDVEVAEEDDEGDLVGDVGLDHPRGEVAVVGVDEVDHLEEGAEELNHL